MSLNRCANAIANFLVPYLYQITDYHYRSRVKSGDYGGRRADKGYKQDVEGHGAFGQTGKIRSSATVSSLERFLGQKLTVTLFRIKWQSAVLSFSFSSKELKASDPLARVRSRLEDLDIKTIIPYVVEQTTHVVQSKRNTAKGLQALVNGRWIVDESYVDGLVYAATPGDLENLESLSPLEADFDTAWPDASLHLPPPGNEPVQRPPEAFAPNPSRIHIFDGFTFIFGDVGQYENLSDAINNAHGKTLLYHVEPGATTAEEIVQYMRNAAGQKGFGDEREGSGGVVLVRFRCKDEDWSIDLGNQVAVLTDQRVIEQREFLDAILANDASSLCRSLPPDPASSQSAPAEATSQPPSQPVPTPSEDMEPPVSQTQEEPSQPSSSRPKAPRVRSFVSKMRNFDDGFDISSIPAHVPEEEAVADTPPAMDLELLPELSSEQSSQQPTRQPTQKRSQRASNRNRVEEEQQEEEQDEDVMAGLLPGASAMKRRRVESGNHRHESPASQPKEEVERKTKRQKLDVLEAARQHREAEEDAQRRQDEEDLKDTDIEKLKGLAIVEEMQLPVREPPRPQAIPDDDQWDDRWNGRKNFKKFRRKGEPRHPRNLAQKVIVPLEEVVRKDYGIGDHYWVSTRASPENSRPASSHRGSLRKEESSLREERTMERDESDNEDDDDDVRIPESQPASRNRSRPESQSLSRPLSRNQSSSHAESQTPMSRSQKRPHEVRDSDSDNEELRFRFRRRR